MQTENLVYCQKKNEMRKYRKKKLWKFHKFDEYLEFDQNEKCDSMMQRNGSKHIYAFLIRINWTWFTFRANGSVEGRQKYNIFMIHFVMFWIYQCYPASICCLLMHFPRKDNIFITFQCYHVFLSLLRFVAFASHNHNFHLPHLITFIPHTNGIFINKASNMICEDV